MQRAEKRKEVPSLSVREPFFVLLRSLDIACLWLMELMAVNQLSGCLGYNFCCIQKLVEMLKREKGSICTVHVTHTTFGKYEPHFRFRHCKMFYFWLEGLHGHQVCTNRNMIVFEKLNWMEVLETLMGTAHFAGSNQAVSSFTRNHPWSIIDSMSISSTKVEQ